MSQTPIFEFHISRISRDRYDFEQGLFSFNGNAIFPNFQAARRFAQKMNAQRDLISHPEQAVKAGQIIAMGLIDEMLHALIEEYRQQRNPEAMAKALAWLESQLDPADVDAALNKFTEEFPPVAVYQGDLSPSEYLSGSTGGISHRQIALEEMLMLWVANANPAFEPFQELFDDSGLERATAYTYIIVELEAFFKTQPAYGPDNLPLVQLLRAPALASPDSLSGQLEYIRGRWGTLLGKYLRQLLTSLDLIKEEEKPIFHGPGPSHVLEFTEPEYYLVEEERFSPDSDWMPRLTLIAKNTYVWLDQLSKEHGQSITRLDQVPDEELDKFARWGFSGLWMIGLWERSSASQRIKQMCGNPEAVPSAYSLYDYVIAQDLGGDEAYDNLRHRAWERGIRLAADMVPNHVGIYSKWVVEHPDWFISLDYSPFPGYTFSGPNLSDDHRVGVYLDDDYFNRTDAAVVFKRVDHWTGDTKYIYHGNDGTAMPWNDTAQLDYLNPEVREAVVQTILHVAKKFPVIRFDAAMTLAKKHFQRLWFPEPGTGGDIPSRAEFGLTRAQFDAAFPTEFWREVVDRVAQEVPDTLLLAEAFWMMEGYFVRTLGMHRVYNSAFMNMLRDEKNAEYRQLIKNTLEFDPQILKRYVNFMNNPDEDTAVEQFGKDDKYFGISTLMATLPGLPMFGHGQVEGYHEKYGMEYRRAYWEEYPDEHLVRRHERQIFPLLHRRYIFAEVENYLLYDFYTEGGGVDENVFAFSNRAGEQKGLVIYHNRWGETAGWIKTSAAYLDKNQGDGTMVQQDLGAGLGLRPDPQWFTIFRDHISGLQFIHSSQELHAQGLYMELSAYKCRVFLDFQEVQDDDTGQYAQLASYLNGRGVPDIDEALQELALQPILDPFRELINPGMLNWLYENRATSTTATPETRAAALSETEDKLTQLVDSAGELVELVSTAQGYPGELRAELETILQLPVLNEYPEFSGLKKSSKLVKWVAPEDNLLQWHILFGWLFTHKMGNLVSDEDVLDHSAGLMDEWLLSKAIASALPEGEEAVLSPQESAQLIRILIEFEDWYEQADGKDKAAALTETMFSDVAVQQFLKVNRYEGVIWFNKEAFSYLIKGLLSTAVVTILSSPNLSERKQLKKLANRMKVIQKLHKGAKKSGYQVGKLLEAL